MKSTKSKKPGTVKKANADKASPKALVLLSGGLDSRLAVKMLQEQLGSRGVEAVFFAWYYNLVNMALIWACRDLGITTVDIQHGLQGKYHVMYSHWTRIPRPSGITEVLL